MSDQKKTDQDDWWAYLSVDLSQVQVQVHVKCLVYSGPEKSKKRKGTLYLRRDGIVWCAGNSDRPDADQGIQVPWNDLGRRVDN